MLIKKDVMFSITLHDSSGASNISCDSKAHSRTIWGWSNSANRSYLLLIWAKAAAHFCRLGAWQKSLVAAAQLQALISALLYFSNQHLLAMCVSFWVFPCIRSSDVTLLVLRTVTGSYSSKYQMSYFASVWPKLVFLGRWACWMSPLDSRTERSSFQLCYQFFLC